MSVVHTEDPVWYFLVFNVRENILVFMLQCALRAASNFEMIHYLL